METHAPESWEWPTINCIADFGLVFKMAAIFSSYPSWTYMTHARIHNRTSLQIKLASWIMGTTNLRYVYQRTPCSVIKKDGTISFDLELLVRHKVIQDICQYAEFCHSSVTVSVYVSGLHLTRHFITFDDPETSGLVVKRLRN